MTMIQEATKILQAMEKLQDEHGILFTDLPTKTVLLTNQAFFREFDDYKVTMRPSKEYPFCYHTEIYGITFCAIGTEKEKAMQGTA